MDESIERKVAIAKLTDLEVIEPNATIADAKRLLADMPGAKAVSLHDIYRVIAGHSYYHGDRILAALTCIVEGKEVNPIRPADVVPVVRCKGCKYLVNATVNANGFLICDVSDMEIAPDDFCSYGEPKEGDHADDHN